MKKKIKKVLAAMTAATMLPAVGLFPCSVSAASSTVVTLDPSNASPFNNGKFEGWGTSLCWWANRLGYSEALTNQAAELFFSEDGLGLDIARYNLGGGDDPSHNHITRSDSKVPGYATGFDSEGNIVYDWSADENQRNIATAALKANPDLYVEGFSNSPPYFMTNSGCSSGAASASNDNLRSDQYDNFAEYIAEVTKHFKDEFGITFSSYSPMNEPDTKYWGADSPKQEGCHYNPGTSQSNMILATRKALDNKGLNDVIVAGTDETSIDTAITSLDKLTNDAKNALGRIDTHSYGGSKRTELKAKAISMNKNLWMSEVDNGGVAGTNPGDMGAGLNLANFILKDMNGMQPSAWVLWDIVDFHKDSDFYYTDDSGNKVYSEKNNALNQSGGLWGVGMGNHDTQKIELTQKYYVFGQFTKYIQPGDTIIASSDNTLAAYNKDTGAIKIVAANTSNSNNNYTFDLSPFTQVGDSVQVIRTSGSFSNGEHWADLGTVPVADKKFDYELKANSVTTFVIDNNVKNVGYISIDGSKTPMLGQTSKYTAKTSDDSTVTWSVSDESIASIDQNGILTPKKEGTVSVIAKSNYLGSSSDYQVRIMNIAKLTIPSANVTGTAAWNNSTTADCKKVVDGNISTYFDGVANGYVVLDLGEPYMIGALGYAPRTGYEYRMIDGIFYGSNDGETWNTIYNVPSKPGSGSITYVYSDEFAEGAADNLYRYIKYAVPSGKQSYNGKQEDYNCNIAEIEVWSAGSDSAFAEALAVIRPDSEVYGNINMPESIGNVNIKWTSSMPSVITSGGEVTRQSEDKSVTLTAVLSSGEESITREYDVVVKASVQNKTEADMQAYLFAHFVGNESSSNHEQIYFSVSKDGSNWQTLNNMDPILTSNVGEGGVRDPHIIRSPEGDKFFIVATDLSIYNRRGDSNRWATCQTSGSKSIVIWESTDLVNWSEARLVQVAPDNAGCTWAPESIYDDETGRYMVFWASKVSDDNYSYQRIYRSYTRDFKTFTEPEIYIDDATAEDIKNNTAVSNIDTSFIKHDGMYYRFTKNESRSSVIMERSSKLDGSFDEVATYALNGTAGNTVTGYEGPTAYKLNGEDKWCLLLDYYSKSQGYKPFVTDDISTGIFTSAKDFVFDSTYRHGTVMPITMDEYNALIEAYTDQEVLERGNLIFDMDFDNQTVSANIGTAEANSALTFSDGHKGKAAILGDKQYITITDNEGKSLLTGLDRFTVSFWSKTDGQSWWFYTAPDNSAQTYKSEKYIGILDSGSKLTCERYNSNNIERPASASASYTNGEWKHVAVVYKDKAYTLYVNGEAVSTVNSDVDISDLLGDNSIAYIGMANWVNGEYSSGAIDEFQIYDYAMTSDGVSRLYNGIWFDSAEISNTGILSYSIGGVSGSDNLYVGVYDQDSKLICVSSETTGSFELPSNGNYTVAAYLWNDNQKPLSNGINKKLSW